MQQDLYAFVQAKYELQETDYNCYGRVYRNYNKDGSEYLPQAYDGGHDYVDVFFNDTVALQTFFDINETIKVGDDLQPTAKVLLYGFLNLTSLYPALTDRADETVSNDIENFISDTYGFIVHEKHTGPKRILNDFAGIRKELAMKEDMQPMYCFALEMELANYYVCDNIQYKQPNTNLLPALRAKATGIDYWIERLQTDLYNYLLNIYDLQPTDYNCYGRVYRNYSKGGNGKEYLPQFFTGIEDYIDVMTNDTVAMQSFFDLGESEQVRYSDLMNSARVHLYFFVDLEQLFPDATERMDMEVMEAVSWFIKKSSPGFVLHAQQIGAKKVLENFTGYRKRINASHDMHPYYCFRLDMSKYYDPSLEQCSNMLPSGVGHEFAPNEFDPNEFA